MASSQPASSGPENQNTAWRWRPDVPALAIAMCAGFTIWVSLGILAVTTERGARLGALPPLWLLPALGVAAASLAGVAGLRRAHAWPLLVTAVLWLPWVPRVLPAAWLIWEGPLEWGVWTAALGGTLVARDWTRPSLRLRPGTTALLVAAASLVASLIAASVLARAGRIPGGDEPNYLIITQSLLFDGDLRIQNNHDRGDYFAYVQNGLPPDFLKRGQDGEIYSVHAPGVSALLLPAFAVAGYAGAVTAIAVIAAIGLLASWLAAFWLARSHAASFAGVLALFASPTMFFHSFAIFPDPVGGAIVAAALVLLVRLHTAPSDVTNAAIALTGGLLGVLPWLHTRFAIVAGAVAVVLLPHLWRRPARARCVAAFAAAPLMLAVAWFAYFAVIYGTLDPAAPYGNSQQNAVAWVGAGLTGLAVDQQFGLIAAAPVMSLLPFGFYVLARRIPRLAIELLTIALPYVLVVASFGMWWGGWSAPARFLVCVLPLAVPLLAYAWLGLGRAGRGVFVGLVAVGAGNIVARLLVLDGALLYNNRDGFDLLLDWLSRTVQLPLAFPSVHRSGPQVALLICAVWAALAAMGGSLLVVLIRRVWSRGAQCAVTTGIGYVVLMSGIALTWQVTGIAEVSPSSSQAEFLRRWDPTWRPIVVNLTGRRRVDTDTAPSELLLRSSERARSAATAEILFSAPWLPGGDYRLVIEGAGTLEGTVTVSIGVTSQAVETWSLDGERAGDTGFILRLPALVHSVTIRGDTDARRTIASLALRPVKTAGPSQRAEYVIRAARYGAARLHFVDDRAYVEPSGVWTRADGTARFFLDADDPRAPVEIDVQAGPTPTVLDMQAGEWHAALSLDSGERQRVAVPSGGVVTFSTTGGFRPVDVDAQSTDPRRLGVRLEFPVSTASPQ